MWRWGMGRPSEKLLGAPYITSKVHLTPEPREGTPKAFCRLEDKSRRADMISAEISRKEYRLENPGNAIQ